MSNREEYALIAGMFGGFGICHIDFNIWVAGISLTASIAIWLMLEIKVKSKE
jgi:hypothetical protein